MGQYVRKAVFFLWALFFLRLVLQVAKAEEPQNGLYTANQAATIASNTVAQ